MRGPQVITILTAWIIFSKNFNTLNFYARHAAAQAYRDLKIVGGSALLNVYSHYTNLYTVYSLLPLSLFYLCQGCVQGIAYRHSNCKMTLCCWTHKLWLLTKYCGYALKLRLCTQHAALHSFCTLALE